MGLFDNFSLKFFKSQKEKELEELQVEEQKLKNALLKQQYDANESNNKPEGEAEYRAEPFKKIKLVNDVLTIILNSGELISKANSSVDEFNKVRKARTESELLGLMSSPEQLKEIKKQEEEVQKVKDTIAGMEILKNSKDFIVEGNSVYLKNSKGEKIERSLPQLLIEGFAQLFSGKAQESAEYEALKKFWLKCCLNPNAQSAEDLYKFLANHQFKIDKHGNFYAYRRVVSKKGENKELVDFVSNAYNKVKAVWKKKSKDYYVWQEDDGNFIFTKDSKADGISKFIGNLEELYLDLPNLQKENYTDAHTRSFDYKVGEVISMPRDKGDDDNNVSCSKGFHAASKAYDYSGFGDTPILLIINPIDVLAVPRGEVGKLRTCRWFFAMTLPENEKYILDDEDFDVSELGDVFEEKCMANLQEYVQNSFAEEVKRHTFTLPQVTGMQVSGIITSLEDMRNAISGRVVEVEDQDEEEYYN